MASYDEQSTSNLTPSLTGDVEMPRSVPNVQGGSTASELWYDAKGRSRIRLITLCIGLKNADGTSLINIDSNPWKLEMKTTIKPKAKDLKEEVMRRSSIFNHIRIKPRPNGWGISELMEWLMTNPIINTADVQFLSREVQRVTKIMQDARIERQREDSLLQVGEWKGKVPYLRLIHCLAEDDIKQSYVHRHDPWSRQMLDSRNSECRQRTVFEMIADRWNSPTFNPSSAISTCHTDYVSPIPLDYYRVASLMPATARKVEDKLKQLRASITRLIRQWEKSGQGDGGRFDTDDESSVPHEILNENSCHFGSLQDRPQYALDNRAAFLHGKPSYLLYFWEFIDKHGLLSTTLQRLNDEVSAVDGASSVPSVTSPTRSCRKRNSEEAALVASIREASKMQLLVSNTEVIAARELHWESRLEKLRDEKRHLKRKINDMMHHENPNQQRIQFYNDELHDLEDEINKINRRLDSLKNKHN